ncbi:MAG: hypothetical protein NXI24_07210 [bacterium]|nr:hypothetical protein [bacterium]
MAPGVLAVAACASIDLSDSSPERPVRVITEDIVQLTYINDYEFGDDVGNQVFVEEGDLQIYFNVRLPTFIAKNMGVTIRASGSDTILICAGSRRHVERPAGFRLRKSDAERAADARERIRICDRLTRR